LTFAGVTVMVACCGAFGSSVVVDPGYDLLATQPGTTFMTLPLQGVPVGSFNFGGSIGVQNTGDADTIVQRLAAATTPSVPGTAPAIPIQMDLLQMESQTPVNLGAGVGFYFVTLQSARGGPVSTGTMTISVDNTGLAGTFLSSLDVFYDVRFGSLSGPIVLSNDLLLSNPGTPWQTTPPDPNDVLINGVNQGLGANSAFWPVGTFTESEGADTQHSVRNAMVPEPTGAGMIFVAAAALLRRKRARSLGTAFE
jgi:hypothetical protein